MVDLVREEYGIELTRQQVASYDPTKATCRGMSKKLKDLFTTSRKAFQENILDIPIANKAFRLKELQGMYNDSGRNRRLKQDLLKQALQETDGRTTKVEHTGKDGADLEIKIVREFVD